jgi:hypothetical protein
MDFESQKWVNQASSRVINPPADHSIHHPLNANNLESSEKSATRKQLKPGWRLFSFILAVIFSYSIYTAWTSPLYKVETIKISGNQRFSVEQILADVHIQGMHIFAVKPEEIIKSIQSAFPEIRDVQVAITLPANVSINVSERQPILAWKTKEGLMWIDTEGYLIPARGSEEVDLTIQADDLPVYQLKNNIIDPGTTKVIQDKRIQKPLLSSLAFFAIPKQVDGSLLSAILQLNAWMPNEKVLLHQKIRGLGWNDARGWPVFVGSKLERINDKMVMYQTIIRELDRQDINPTLVSVEFLHAPYYRVD